MIMRFRAVTNVYGMINTKTGFVLLGAAISSSFALLKKAELELREVVTENLNTAVKMSDKHSLER